MPQSKQYNHRNQIRLPIILLLVEINFYFRIFLLIPTTVPLLFAYSFYYPIIVLEEQTWLFGFTCIDSYVRVNDNTYYYYEEKI